MRRQRQREFCVTRAAWTQAALWACLLVPSMLPLQRLEAQQAGDITPPVSSTQADEQIASLLGQVETLLDEGHVASPPGGNASEVFTRALMLSSSASPAGLRRMAEFPSALKKRADAERATGHGDLSVRIDVFADVVSSVIGSRDTLSRAGAAPSTKSEDATATAGSDDPAARKAPTAEQAAPPVSEQTRDDGASSSKAIVSTRSPLPGAPISTNSIAQHDSSSAGITGPPASPGGQNVATANGSGGGQVAARPPAPSASLSPDGIAGIPEPAKVPPRSAAMIDALLKQGRAMLSIGDISAARLLFARAAESGNGEAALALGDTYNSAFLAAHGVMGPQADPELAKRWYRKALRFNTPRARERLAGLGDDTHIETQGSTNSQ